MSDRIKPSQVPVSDSQTDENNMRRALGLQGTARPVMQQRPDQARARHKFVQDGGVPVVVVNRSDDATAPFKARIAEIEGSLEAERAAHSQTKRALADAQAASQALQTRLTHADLAQRDALAAERQARDAADAVRHEVAQLQAKLAEVSAKSRLARREPVPQEPQPVKWWLPNYKTVAK